MDIEPVIGPFDREEEKFASSVEADLPTIGVLGLATDRLGWVLQHAGFEATDKDPPPASYVRAKALMYMGVLAVRAARAAIAVLRVGYEAEVLAYKRMLLELHSRTQRVLDDESGEYARQWLTNRAGKPARSLRDVPDGLWDVLSNSSHADARAVENFHAVSHEDGASLVVLPERRSPRGRQVHHLDRRIVYARLISVARHEREAAGARRRGNP